MSFTKRFDDESKKFLRDKSHMLNMRNQKQNLIKSVKEVIVDLLKNEIEQVKKILLKVIEMLKANLKENVENSSKLIRTLNRIESKFQTIEKQNVNQSTKTKTYANVMKTTRKITRTENEKKNTVKKATTVNMMTTKKKKELTVRIKNEIEKKRFRQITNIKLLKRIKRTTEKSKSETIKLR